MSARPGGGGWACTSGGGNRRPCGSVKVCFTLDFVLLFEFGIGAERDLVSAVALVVGDTAPTKPGKIITKRVEKIVSSIIGQVSGEVRRSLE